MLESQHANVDTLLLKAFVFFLHHEARHQNIYFRQQHLDRCFFFNSPDSKLYMINDKNSESNSKINNQNAIFEKVSCDRFNLQPLQGAEALRGSTKYESHFQKHPAPSAWSRPGWSK